MSSFKHLQKQYDVLSEKIHRLKMAHTLETDVAVTFKLEKEIEDAEAELSSIEQQLEGKDKVVITCPYRGLSTFREQDERFFFGRETYVEQLDAALSTHPLIALIGASGSGKSSVVYAGLIPRLRRQENWQILVFRPGEHPFHALVSEIMPLWQPDLHKGDALVEVKTVSDHIMRKRLSLHDVVDDMMQGNTDTRLLLVADQFEELYTLCRDEDERRQFLDELFSLRDAAEISGRSERHWRVILTMRADFLGNALSYRPFADAFHDSAIALGPMNQEEVRDAVELPARALDVGIEDGLITRILDDIGNGPGNLPLLEFALTELWTKQVNRVLSHAAYNQIGGVEHALSRHANETFEAFSTDEQEQAERIFVQLVHPGGEGTDHTRRVATRSEIGDDHWSFAAKLADTRLVVTGKKQRDTIELAHEVLIRTWPRFQEWIRANLEFRRWQDWVRGIIAKWRQTGEDEALLLRGKALEEAEKWVQSEKQQISAEEIRFIQASATARNTRRAERDKLIHDKDALLGTVTRIGRILAPSKYVKLIGTVMSIGLCLVVITFYFLSRPAIGLVRPIKLLEIFEARTLDLRFKLRGIEDPGQDIFIVVLDEKTEEKLERWQSAGRNWLAEMINTLRKHGARVIGLDLSLTTADPGSVPEAIDTLAADYRHDDEFAARAEQVKTRYNYDYQLAQAMHNAGNVVLAEGYQRCFSLTAAAFEALQELPPGVLDSLRNLQDQTACGVAKFVGTLHKVLDAGQIAAYQTRIMLAAYAPQSTNTGTPAGLRPPGYNTRRANLPVFSEAAKRIGHGHTYYDVDGYIRRVPLVINYQQQHEVYTFGLEILRVYGNAAGLQYTGESVVLQPSAAAINEPDIIIPTDQRGTLYINYYGPSESFPHISLHEVIDANSPVDKNIFAGKIVLFGSITRVYHDVISTPFEADTYPAIEMHATVIANILQQNFLQRSQEMNLIEMMAMLVLGGTLGVFCLYKGPVHGIAALTMCILLILGGGHAIFLLRNIWLNVTFPLLLVLMEYAMITIYKHLIVQRVAEAVGHEVTLKP